MNGLWYCPAYCLKSNAIREFRVDHMIKVEQTKIPADTQYPVIGSIHKYLEHLEKGEDYHIKIKLINIGVKRCEAEFLLARGLHILPNGGYIDLSIPKAALEWVADYFLPFGEDAAILEPIELINITKDKVNALYAQYCKSKFRRAQKQGGDKVTTL